MNGHASPSEAGSRVIHWARGYDFFTELVPFVRGLRLKLLELAAPASGERTLDVGCGTGRLAIAVAARVGAGEACGIDASVEMIDVARRNAAKAGAKVDFRVARIEALPFPDASFDLVTSSLMLHHLPAEAKRSGLAQLRRVLKPGGRVVVVDFAAQSHSPLGHVLSVLGHGHGASTVEELTPLLQEAGFTAVEVVPTRRRNFVFLRAR